MGNKRIFLAAFSIFWLAIASGAADGDKITIDFEGFEKGAVVTTLDHPGSEGSIRVYGVNPGFAENASVIFDSADPGREDLDLGSPHSDFSVTTADGGQVPGPGQGEGGVMGKPCENAQPLGKILIVDDDLAPVTEDGRVQEPNDEGRPGARLLIDFSEIGPVTIHGMAVIDVEEPDARVRFYSVGIDPSSPRPSKKRTMAYYRVHTDDNGVARLFDPELRNVPEEGCHVTLERRKHGKPLEPVSGVNSMEIDFSGSGAVARIIYSVAGSKASAAEFMQ